MIKSVLISSSVSFEGTRWIMQRGGRPVLGEKVVVGSPLMSRKFLMFKKSS